MSKDFVLMVIAFIAGVLLIAMFAGGSGKTEQPPAPGDKQQKQIGSAPAVSDQTGATVCSLPNGYFLCSRGDNLFLLCQLTPNKKLKVIDAYKLEHNPDRFFASSSQSNMHGWYFESISEKSYGYLNATIARFGAIVKQDKWAEAEAVAEEVAAAGGVDFLLDALTDESDTARRAAALALAKRDYIEAVPVLARMLREGTGRKRTIELLISLTGKDFSDARSTSIEPVIEKYLDWWQQYQKDRDR